MGSGSENRMKSRLEERESGRSGRQWKVPLRVCVCVYVFQVQG